MENPQALIEQDFVPANGFPFKIRVKAYLEAHNFGGLKGTQPAFKCGIWGNATADCIHPAETFLEHFTPYVAPAAPVKPEPAAVAVEKKD